MSTTATGIRTAFKDSLDYFTACSSVEQAKQFARTMRLDQGWVIAQKKPDAKRAYILSAREFGELIAAGGQAIAVVGAPATFIDPDTDEYPLAADHWKDLT